MDAKLGSDGLQMQCVHQVVQEVRPVPVQALWILLEEGGIPHLDSLLNLSMHEAAGDTAGQALLPRAGHSASRLQRRLDVGAAV